jgi:2-keto-4-pentenoate hydratase/2-oxohepta-3-ene-1,7-dioic acid hydratase in catechol pathway
MTFQVRYYTRLPGITKHEDTILTRVFSYSDKNDQPLVGVEWQGRCYNFTLAWELYKQIAMNNQGPIFQFVQMIIEMGLFHAETFDELFETLKKYRPLDDLIIRGQTKMKVPIERPQKIICAGRNYREHAAELDNPVAEEPILFCKSPSAMIASGDFIRIPPAIGRVDHEGELAVVIGKRGADIKSSQASEYIAGYTILNDVTARELQKQDKKKGLPWFRAKNFDTFCPIGPYIVPANTMSYPEKLQVTVKVNGEIRQNGNTGDMITPVPELISYISRYMTLIEGDIIATGTPAGVSPLRKGDTVEVEITGIGILENRVL